MHLTAMMSWSDVWAAKLLPVNVWVSSRAGAFVGRLNTTQPTTSEGP